ncbi:MAG: UvrD-helicase domain-containing protein, partial [Acidobacteria bacterium]|nr:UvrD-helicase domain-containing protein [Acidobacteriota bacterium]
MRQLNSAQLEAIRHGEGPLLVVAGAGSGKTTVITERFRFLISQGVEPGKLLALTFTGKAAREMEQRVQAALPETRESLHISTFHSFCYQILKTRHFDRKILDKVDHWIFLRQRIEKLGLEFYQKLPDPGAYLHDLNGLFSRCQDELVEPEDFEAYVRAR